MFTGPKTKLRNKSGTITAGGTSQEVWNEQDKGRFYCVFQNVSDTDMTIDFGIPAVADKGILIKAGVAWETPAGVMFDGPLNVLCATTGKKFMCKIA